MLESLPEVLVDLGAVAAAVTAIVGSVALVVRYANRMLTERIVEIEESLRPNGGSSVGDLPVRLTELEASMDDSFRSISERLDTLEERSELLKLFIVENRRALRSDRPS